MIYTEIFVDGAHLREISKHRGCPLMDPIKLSLYSSNLGVGENRLTYYDGLKDEEPVDSPISKYWDAIVRMDGCHLGFGRVVGEKEPRQKGVDTLISVHMLSGAYRKSFEDVLLIAGDADFVPVLEEVKRYGIMTRLLAFARGEDSAAEDLIRTVDRFHRLEHDIARTTHPPFALVVDGLYFVYDEDEKLITIRTDLYGKPGHPGPKDVK